MNRIDYETLETVRRFLELIRDRYDVAGAILYGSRARGTHDPESDADVVVLLRGERRRRLPVKLDMAGTACDLMLDTAILVSPLPVWIDEWNDPENFSNPALLRTIGLEGVWL
jgi:predicted nucleotidyltransferase